MPSASRIVKADHDQLPADMVELGQQLAALPGQYREHLEVLFARVADSTRRRRRILNLVQDALSQLRLDMKYLMFDLEATRRERDDFRERLDDA